MTTLYGIKNCDTIKKARKWLEANGVDYNFHDVRTNGLNAAMVQKWIDAAGWETVLNKRGTTWRKLDADIQQSVDASNVTDLLLEHPAMIKRPVLEIESTEIESTDTDNTIEVGFKESRYHELLIK